MAGTATQDHAETTAAAGPAGMPTDAAPTGVAPAGVAFEEDSYDPAARVLNPDDLLLNLDGYEGPIDVLLTLARDQKVDLSRISILQLAQQYLAFIDRARDLRIELAADYLVMAAWLAYLKSRLLVPQDKAVDDDGLSGPALAEALAFQLKRLEAVQDCATRMFDRPMLGRDVFARGGGPVLVTETEISYGAKLYDLLKAYGAIARRHTEGIYEIKAYNLVTTDEAMSRLVRMLGNPGMTSKDGWISLQSFLPSQLKDALMARSAVASTFTAGLEMVKQGQAEIRQDSLFAPIYIRALAPQNGHAVDNPEGERHDERRES